MLLRNFVSGCWPLKVTMREPDAPMVAFRDIRPPLPSGAPRPALPAEPGSAAHRNGQHSDRNGQHAFRNG